MKRRTVLAGIKKSTQFTTTKGTKAPTLFDHTSKIEQKLSKLKQQIDEKKKTGLAKFKPPVEKTTSVDKQLTDFLTSINMTQYLQVLYQNGIDSFEIMREIKQKQLEEIGVTKGHALKIMVSMRKQLESREKNLRKQLSSAETAENTQKIASKSSKIAAQNFQKTKKRSQVHQETLITKPLKQQPLQIVIQTQTQASGIGEEQLPKRRYFCMYCYQVSMGQFCSPDCEQMYNKMFEKYEKNLAKVYELYGSKVQRVSQVAPENESIDDGQFVSDLNFLDLQDGQGQDEYQNTFNEDAYKEALLLIKIANQQGKEQGIAKAMSDRQQFEKLHLEQ